MTGELMSEVVLVVASLTSWLTSMSMRSPAWIVGLTESSTPVERYWIACRMVGLPWTLVEVDCWLVRIGTSDPTWMRASEPLLVSSRGLDRMLKRSSLARALTTARV